MHPANGGRPEGLVHRTRSILKDFMQLQLPQGASPRQRGASRARRVGRKASTEGTGLVCGGRDVAELQVGIRSSGRPHLLEWTLASSCYCCKIIRAAEGQYTGFCIAVADNMSSLHYGWT